MKGYKQPTDARRHARLVRRGPVETTTGMIRVKVDVQQETEDSWFARVQGTGPKCHCGRTRKDAIQLALKGASVPPNAESIHPHPNREKR